VSYLSSIAGAGVRDFWKMGAVAALALGLLASAALGYQWHMAAHDRDSARADLATEQAVTADLRTSIREQNRAVEVMGQAKETAEARGQAAQQLAAANGRRFDGALEQIKNIKATTCGDAMPAVNAILEAIK
jgi:predicted negative regulator of RcsB-dependent stress response